MLKISKRSLILILVGILVVWGIWGGFSLFYHYSGKSDKLTFIVEDESELHIETNKANIFISSSGSDTLLAESVKAGDINFDQDGNVLELELEDRKFLADGFLTLEIPSNIKKIVIESSVGDIDIASVDVPVIKIDVETGGITLTNIETEEIDLGLDVGSVDAESVKALNSFMISIDVGDISISNTNAKKMKVSSSTGDIYIAGGDYNSLDAFAGVGDISIDLDSDDYTYTLNADDIYLFDEYFTEPMKKGDGERQVDAKTKTGCIEIQ